MQHFYAMTAAKQRLLYKDHQNMKKQAEQEIKRIKDEAADAFAAKEAAEIRADEMDKAVKALSNRSSDEVRRSLVESQRNVTVLRVNETTLRRRHMAVSDSEARCLKEVAKLKVGGIFAESYIQFYC